MTAVALEGAWEASRFGGKAVQLGVALRAGLPVPEGVALDVDLVERTVSGDGEARAACVRALDAFGGARVAARSSAVGEDGQSESFAGQHATRLGVGTAEGLFDAIAEVWRSARSPGALAYREKLGIAGEPRVGVVVQRMVDPTSAGVLFTKNPMNGADERVIEAAWGLGEVVVAGLVVPDRYRMRRGGEVVERTAGEKDVAIRLSARGETERRDVEAHLIFAHCLDELQLASLDALATACDHVFEGAHDIEWAFERARLFLLQRRAITR